MSDPSPTSREFFEELYRAEPDPWRFADDAYEHERYRRILAAVPAGRYATALEPGCSIGVLTRQLADHCGRVIAFDIAEYAVARARRRCADRPNVELSRGALPDDLPTEPVDLVVLSEIGYYFELEALVALIRRIRDLLRPGGRVVAAHWLGSSADHVLHGRDVHATLALHLGLDHRQHAEHGSAPGRDEPGSGRVAAFVLDVWDAA